MITCPACNGERARRCFADGHDAYGRWGGSIVTAKCWTCDGQGSITPEHAERIEAGRERRQERLKHGLSLMEAAAIAGISPAKLSAIESGREPETGEK